MIDAPLMKKREELKLRLEVGNYPNIPEKILDGIGWLIRELTQNTKNLPLWISGLVLFLITLLLGLVLSIILSRTHPFLETIIVLVIIVTTTGFISLILGKQFLDSIFAEFRDHIVDSIQSFDDLSDFQNWVSFVCNAKYQLICGAFYSLLGPGIFIVTLQNSAIGFIGIGPILSIIFPWFQGGLFAYYLLAYLPLPGRLGRYKYKLYKNDPSQSYVIDHLSNILNKGVLTFSLLMAISTVSLPYMWRYYSIGVRIFVLLIMWIPIIAIFIINQSALSKIVRLSKKRKLNEIQAKIEKLEKDDDIVNKETMEAINRLMDYHDRIRDSKNSTLSVRSVINFINSLLLPLISTLLSRITEVLGFFK